MAEQMPTPAQARVLEGLTGDSSRGTYITLGELGDIQTRRWAVSDGAQLKITDAGRAALHRYHERKQDG